MTTLEEQADDVRCLFHAAGANRTADVRRMANLLQVSSALGRAMEAVDRAATRRYTYSTKEIS